jgi:cysteinyl-tRNA synthetase
MTKKLHLFNSLSKQKEEFVPINNKNIGIYVCGPTIYSNPHIGNARSTVIYDVLYRLLKYLYPKVTFVRNITDVDDKIIQAAIERGISIKDLTTEIQAEFNEDMRHVGNLQPDHEPKVTDNMPDIIAMIEKLIAKGHAYESAGHVYFSVSSFKEYGLLSGRKTEELKTGARIEIDKNKKDANDFVLWKPAKKEDDKSAIFASPFSKGRPGWHIECSAMSTKILGKNFDIHGGGADLKFPHHENEIAQSTCCHDDSNYAKYWVHNGFLTVNGEKMSKSLGNFITVRELLDSGVEGRLLRYLFLTTHYRKPLDYNYKLLEESRSLIRKIDELIEDFDIEKQASEELPQEFLESLLDDLNLAKANSYLIKMVKAKNIKEVCTIINFLGIGHKEKKEEIPVEILSMAREIQLSRMNKDFSQADKLRDELVEKGYAISYDKAGEVKVRKDV